LSYVRQIACRKRGAVYATAIFFFFFLCAWLNGIGNSVNGAKGNVQVCDGANLGTMVGKGCPFVGGGGVSIAAGTSM
jgi:hypothetical protein